MFDGDSVLLTVMFAVGRRAVARRVRRARRMWRKWRKMAGPELRHVWSRAIADRGHAIAPHALADWRLTFAPRTLVYRLATPALYVLLLLIASIATPRIGPLDTDPLVAATDPTAVASATATHGVDASGGSLLALSHSRALDPLPAGDNWDQYRSDVAGTGSNAESLLSTLSVAQLRTEWVFSGNQPFLATPAIVDGVAYTTSGESLDAIDLHSGRLLWHFDAHADGGAVNSSVAVDPRAHLAFFGTSTALLYAVNLTAHAEAWDVRLGNPAAGAYIWSSPLVVNGMVYVGLASHDDQPCVRGAVIALDERSGATRWTHFMVHAGALGGAVWSSVTADVASQVVIATTGNPCPGGSDFDQTDSIVAMNWNTGATVWQYSPLTDDIYDWDFGEGAAIFTLHGQEYIVAGNKYGMVYGVTPPSPGGSATLAWSYRIAHSGFLGAGGIFEPPTYSQGIVVVAGGPTLDGDCPTGALTGFQADTGTPLWRDCTPTQVIGAAAATGDLLFVPMAGRLEAYSIFTGQPVWIATQNGQTWGGVAISRGFVLSGTLGKDLYCYALPPAQLPHMR